jgi:NADH-quinone oxidoreductase subunit L
MVARMSPLFELSTAALSFVLVIGAITAFFMGLLGLVQNDIKRVVAYSTLSQLGYMTVALGASAYPVAIFHLMTHAFFKALLFLAAGSVIMGLHHDQDMRNMGGLRKTMPWTHWTMLIGSLALIGTPFFSGFYSKDSIILAVHAANVPGADIAYAAVLAGVFVTALYSFRLYFMVFWGEERFGHAHHGDHGDDHGDQHHGLAPGAKPHESPAVVLIPLLLLAIPSAVIGFVTIRDFLFGDFFKGVIFIDAAGHPAMTKLAGHFHGPTAMALHGLVTLPFFLALAGVVTAWFLYIKQPELPGRIAARLGFVYRLLDNKYYLDRINEIVFAGGARLLGRGLWRGGDQVLIDGLAVNGSARLVGWLAGVLRVVQTGYLYHYAMAMLVGVAVALLLFLTWPYLQGAR